MRYILIAATILALHHCARAQETTGALIGTVVDAKKEGLPGATVVAVHTPSGTRYGTGTDKNGSYFIPNVRTGGPYTITTSFIGYATQVRDNVNAVLGQSTETNFTLIEEGTTLETVTVTGTAITFVNEGQNINSSQLKTLPSGNRNFQDFSRTTPQFNNNSFAGTNFRYNNVTIDGAINNDAIGFSPSLGGQTGTSGQPGSSTRTSPISLDAIEDMQVYIAPYDVKLGNFTGGSVNAVTRSGTNKVTGSVYGFGKGAPLTGPNNAGDGRKIPGSYHDYQTGFRLGFPIIKDKLFFFTSEEITRRQDPILLEAGSKDESQVIGTDSAKMIVDFLKNKYGFDAGSYGIYNIYSQSNKFFNRIDWNINDKSQLTIRNNTVISEATNLERDQQNFRFSSIDYVQRSRQSSSVVELRTKFNDMFSNNVIVGYTDIHDFRTPKSDPSFPQVQIVGATPGTTIFLGTDREASIFDMKQKTFEITDNFVIRVPKNTITIGTHNELYNITYGFVNSWNGRVDYFSVTDFLNNKPNRVRGNYNYTDNTRDYILSNPGAKFNVGIYSFYAQDEFQATPRLRITPGVRVDLTNVPQKQSLSFKTVTSPVDKYYGGTYAYTPPREIRNDYFGAPQFSPRVGFSYDVREDKSLVVRGGTGMFVSRIPFAWLGYAFYNTGDSYGAYDQRYNIPFTPGSDPLLPNPIGNANFAKQNGRPINNPNTPTQVDMIDNGFKMPQVWRSSLAFDYLLPNDYQLVLEGIYTKTITDLKFQQTNLEDYAIYYPYDTKHQQPIFSGNKINSNFTNAYLLSNTSQGYRYNLTAQLKKTYKFCLSFMGAYTYGVSKDITNGIRNSMESNWQLNQALNPNNPKLAYSNFDLRHRIVSTLNYNYKTTNVSIFFNAASGQPFTYGFVNASAQNTPQQVSLAYIPTKEEAIHFFDDPAQANAFNTFIDNNQYLNSKRGDFTKRNEGRTPWNITADFRLSQDIRIKNHTITITYDILNLTNLLDKDWGKVYFVPSTFNSTSSVGLTQVMIQDPTDFNAPDPSLRRLIPKVKEGYPVYTFKDPGLPYSIDFLASRWQMQLGLRYSF